MNTLNQKELSVHVPIIGWLLILGNGVMVLAACFVVFLLPGIGIISQDSTALGILATIGVSVAAFLVFLALPGVVSGFGLLKRKAWGRVLAIVVSILSLVAFPVGTLVGLYAIWVLFQEGAHVYFGALPEPTQVDEPKDA